MVANPEKRIFVFSVLLVFVLITCSSIAFDYEWEIGYTPEGQESFTPIPPTQIEILGDVVEIPNNSAAIRLRKKYGIYVDTTFSQRHAYLLLQVINRMPKLYRNDSLWSVSPNHIHNDIEFEIHDDIDVVSISDFAFTYSNPLLANVDGSRGRLYSNRLFRSVVRYITNHGTEFGPTRDIMSHRYGITFQYHGYSEITKNTTKEDSDKFEPFKPDEIIDLISVLEEFPSGMRKIDGMDYILRRRDGLEHPIYPQASS